MSKPHPSPRLGYRINELCAVIGLGRTTIYALIASGQLDVVRVGRCTIVKAESVQALLNKSKEVS